MQNLVDRGKCDKPRKLDFSQDGVGIPGCLSVLSNTNNVDDELVAGLPTVELWNHQLERQ